MYIYVSDIYAAKCRITADWLEIQNMRKQVNEIRIRNGIVWWINILFNEYT